MAANSTERLHHSSRSDKPKPSQQGVDDVRTGQRDTITPVAARWRPFVKRGLRPAGRRGRHAGSDGGAVRRDPVARRLSGDEVVRWAAHCVQSGDRHPGDFRHAGGGAFRSRPLGQAEGHVHDCPVALGAHREAASLEHIQHRGVFREDLGGELTKSGLTAEGCEMAHQC